VRESYRNVADVVMESLWSFGASAEALKRRVDFENHEIIDRAVAARQSVVLLAPHFCNWEWLLGAGAATFQLPIDVVYQKIRLKSRRFLPEHGPRGASEASRSRARTSSTS
jgi:lauroyl/myristoyl acyltransferase